MSKRKYGYVVIIREEVAEDEYTLFAVMEALKISPYTIDTGYGTNLDTFSDEISPSEIPTFINLMGEPDSFSFIKVTDQTSLDLMQAKEDVASFNGYVSLGVISLSKVPKKLHGRARLAHMFNKAEAYIDLDDCMVSTAWTNIKRESHAAVDIITMAGILRSQ
jgi:hypothetical protein